MVPGHDTRIAWNVPRFGVPCGRLTEVLTVAGGGKKGDNGADVARLALTKSGGRRRRLQVTGSLHEAG